MKSIKNITVSAKESVSNWSLKAVVAAQVALAGSASAQTSDQFTMPTATIPGAEEGADTGSIVIAAFKWAGLIIVWIMVMLMALAMLKNIVKSVNKVRRDEDTAWPAVVGDIAGNALTMVVVVVFGTWISGFLA